MRFNSIKAVLAILYVLCLALAAQPVLSAEAKSNLSWDAPTTRVDGTALQATQIEEFRIYYGIGIGDDSLAIGPEYTAVTGENAAELTVELTPRAEPYVLSFAITTVDRDGLQSVLSETVTKTFQVDSTAAPSVPTSLKFSVTCGDGCSIEQVEGQ
jgi:hypothetical protein